MADRNRLWGHPIVLKVQGSEVPVTIKSDGRPDYDTLHAAVLEAENYHAALYRGAGPPKTVQVRTNTTAFFEIVGDSRASLEGQARQLAVEFAQGAAIDTLDVDAHAVGDRDGFQATVFVRLR